MLKHNIYEVVDKVLRDQYIKLDEEIKSQQEFVKNLKSQLGVDMILFNNTGGFMVARVHWHGLNDYPENFNPKMWRGNHALRADLRPNMRTKEGKQLHSDLKKIDVKPVHVIVGDFTRTNLPEFSSQDVNYTIVDGRVFLYHSRDRVEHSDKIKPIKMSDFWKLMGE